MSNRDVFYSTRHWVERAPAVYFRTVVVLLIGCVQGCAGGPEGDPGPDGEGGAAAGGAAAGAGGAESSGGGASGGAASGGSAAGGNASGGSASGGTESAGGGAGGALEEGGTGAAPDMTESYEGGPCPSQAPEVGTPCAPSFAFCSYGAAAEPGCRQRFSCGVAGTWQVDSVTGGGCPRPAGLCDTEPQGVCDDAGERCVFEQSMCTCHPEQHETCGGDGCHPLDPPIPQQWECELSMTAEDCPSLAPNAGTVCDEQANVCLYGEWCFGVLTSCEEGYISWEAALCP